MIDNKNLGSTVYQFAVIERGGDSTDHVVSRSIPTSQGGQYEITYWNHPFAQPTPAELDAAEQAYLTRKQQATARKARIAADKGQGVSVPDLVARLDDLIDELGLS